MVGRHAGPRMHLWSTQRRDSVRLLPEGILDVVNTVLGIDAELSDSLHIRAGRRLRQSLVGVAARGNEGAMMAPRLAL